MTKEEIKILSVQFQNDEVDVWKSIVTKLNKIASKTGFKKEFNSNEVEIIKALKKEEDE